MNHHARIVASRPHGPTYLVLSDSDEGCSSWFYVQVSLMQEHAFLRAVRTENWNCKDYGQVIASGYGSRPPAYVTWELKAAGLLPN